MRISQTLVLIVLLFYTTQGTLVAYQNFDDDTSTIYSGDCLPRDGLRTSGVLDVDGRDVFVDGIDGGRAVQLNLGGPLGNFTASEDIGDFVLNNAGANKLSICFWVLFDIIQGAGEFPSAPGYDIPLITKRGDTSTLSFENDNSFSWGFFGENGFEPQLTRLVFAMKFNDTDIEDSKISLFSDNGDVATIAEGVWTHVCGVYDGSVMSLYVQGALTFSVVVDDLMVESNATVYVGGFPYDDTVAEQMRTPVIDEVRIYDSALSAAEILALATLPLDINTPPSISLDSSSVDVFLSNAESEIIAPTVVDAESQAELTYFWEETSTVGCSVAFIQSDPFDRDLSLGFSNIGDGLTFAVSAFDGELCAFDEVTVNVIGEEPDQASPFLTEYVGFLTETISIKVNFTGFPIPSFSWRIQQLINISNDEGMTFEEVLAFIEIPGETSDTIVFEDIDLSLNGTVINCVLANIYGRFQTPATSLRVINELPPVSSEVDGDGGEDGDGDDTLPIIVAVVIGVFICCCCCILILLLILIIVFALRKKNGNPYGTVKLYDPEYDAIAYGPMLQKNKYGLSGSQVDELKRLEELLMDDFALPRILCDNARATEAELIAKGLTFVYYGNMRAPDLIKFFVTQEVKKSNKKGTLFRSNSIATKMFNAYAKITCIEYVYGQFALPVGQLNKLAQDTDDDENDAGEYTTSTLMGPMVLEVDPSKMEDAGDEKVNTLKLWLIAQRLFSGLTRSCADIPKDVRDILHHVYTEVNGKFSESEAYKAMGAFFFLRFLCPSLMAPQLYGLLRDPPHSTAQRQLVLLAKVMQNLANDTLPGKKEGYMARLNDFIETNRESLRGFYDVIIAKKTEGPSSKLSMGDNVKNNALASLHNHINTYYDKLMNAVQTENEELAEELQECMEAIGDVDD